jgi:hypothetical protein
LNCAFATGPGDDAFAAGSFSALGFFSFFSFAALGAASFFGAATFFGFSTRAGVFAYFLRNRSMRPCVSSSFCLPVKNGWQLLQMSRCRSPLVDRVSQVAPQAQCTLAVG